MNNTHSLSFTVSNNSELKAALAASSAAGGGTILLENTGGTYNLNVTGMGSSTGVTTIKSENADNPAVMDGVRLLKSENIAFENLSFNSMGVSRPSWVKDFMVENGQNISVSDSTFISSANGTIMEKGDGVTRGEDMGFVRGTTGFTFENNTVSNYFNGLTLIESNDIIVTGNEFTKMQGDGIRGGGMQDAVFEGNWLHDWYGSSKSFNHDDMFQIWGTNMEQLSKNILIKGNFFDSGEGSATQTILIQNEHWKTDADNYTNIVITDNVIYNGHTHGISVFDTTGVEVTNNTVLYNAQSSTPTNNVSNAPGIRVGNGEDAVVTGNIAAKTFVAGSEQLEFNAKVNFDSPALDSYVSHNFVNVSNGGTIDLRDLELLSDSPWHGKYGATASQGGNDQPGVTAVMTQTAVKGNYGAFVLDASLTHDKDGYLDAYEANFEWHFTDGSIIKSQTVEVDFNTVGLNEITLIATRNDGTKDSITRSVMVEDPIIRAIDFDDGAATKGVTFEDADASNYVAGLSGQGFLLDGDSEVRFNKKDDRFYELDQFTIEVAFQKLDGDETGRLFDLHRSMGISINAEGSLGFSMKTDDGGFNVSSGSTLVQDQDWHKVSVTYNAAYEELVLWLDGEKLDVAHATGKTIPFESWGPMLGNFDFKGESVKAVVDDFVFSKESKNGADIRIDHIDAMKLQVVEEPSAGANKFHEAIVRETDFNDGADTSGISFQDVDESNFVAGLEGQGFLLDGDSEVRFNKKDSDFYDLDQFTIETAFQKMDDTGAGTMFSLHRAMGLSVQNDGSVKFNMKTMDGSFSVNSGTATILDTDWHKVTVTYDASQEALALWLDGEKLGETHATGLTIPYEHWGPMLGVFDFKGDSLNAVLDDFIFARAARSDMDIQQDHADALSLGADRLGEIHLEDAASEGTTARAVGSTSVTQQPPVIIGLSAEEEAQIAVEVAQVEAEIQIAAQATEIDMASSQFNAEGLVDMSGLWVTSWDLAA